MKKSKNSLVLCTELVAIHLYPRLKRKQQQHRSIHICHRKTILAVIILNELDRQQKFQNLNIYAHANARARAHPHTPAPAPAHTAHIHTTHVHVSVHVYAHAACAWHPSVTGSTPGWPFMFMPNFHPILSARAK